jgi:glycosyltransferase involved in cell wall biosynthesis
MIHVSIIICTHNRASLLRQALLSLYEMDVPEDCAAELIVADNASTDDTSSVIDEFSGRNKFHFKHIFESRLGKTFALNKAICSSSGDVIALIDDDHIISNGYLKAVCKAVQESPSCNIFCGRVFPDWDGTEPQWVHDNDRYPIRPFPVPCFDLGHAETEIEIERDGMFIPGAGNLVIRKELFQRIGYFSEQFGPRGHNLSGGEDIEFLRRALIKGERILYVPDILQHHQVNQINFTMSYVVKKGYQRSMAAHRFLPPQESGGIPKYLFRQTAERFLKALFSFDMNARRYYLVRLAAVIGEIAGRCRPFKGNIQS